jgi:hypothetical protein
MYIATRFIFIDTITLLMSDNTLAKILEVIPNLHVYLLCMFISLFSVYLLASVITHKKRHLALEG